MDGAFPSSLGDTGDGERRRGFRGTSENAKTKLCLRWKSGHCRFGDACNFAHGEEELRQLPPRNYSQRGGGGGGRGGYGGFEAGGYPQGPRVGGGGHAIDQGAFFRGARQGPGPVDGHAGGAASFGEPGPLPGARGPAENDAWAQQGFPVPGPNGWTQYTTLDTAEPYYHNHVTGETVWDRPPEWR